MFLAQCYHIQIWLSPCSTKDLTLQWQRLKPLELKTVICKPSLLTLYFQVSIVCLNVIGYFTITVHFLARWLAQLEYRWMKFESAALCKWAACTRHTCLSKTFFSQILASFGFCYCKKQHASVYASVLLLRMNFVTTVSKFAAEPLACGLSFHSHFDNVMT